MIRNLFWNKLDCFFCSTLQTLYLGFYCLWMVPMLLPVKKWLQLCPVQKLLLIKGFKNALKLWWQRSVLGEIHLTSRLEQVAYSPAYLSSSIICVALACWFFAFYVFFFFFFLILFSTFVSIPLFLIFMLESSSTLSASLIWCSYDFHSYVKIFCSCKTLVQVERLLSAEQKATDYRLPDDGIAPDHRPTNACTRYI